MVTVALLFALANRWIARTQVRTYRDVRPFSINFKGGPLKDSSPGEATVGLVDHGQVTKADRTVGGLDQGAGKRGPDGI